MKSPSKLKGVVVDGDILVYRCGFVAQRTIRCITHKAAPNGVYFDSAEGLRYYIDEQMQLGVIKDEGDYTITTDIDVQPLGHAVQALNTCLREIQNSAGLPIRGLFLSTGSETFRHKLAVTKPYKGNRKSPRPVHYDGLRDYMVTQRGARVFEEIEADDALASFAKTCVVASIDKDLLQVPGAHYNFVEKRFIHIGEDDGHYNLALQLITGDSIDNIPGIRGMAEKKATAFLEEKIEQGASMQDLFRHIAEEIYMPKMGDNWWPYYKEQLSLLYLLRHRGDSAMAYLKTCWGDNELLEGMDVEW